MEGAEIVRAAARPLSERIEYAKLLASAGDMLPDGLRDKDKPGAPGNPAKILLVMETARVLGVPEIRALDGIDVIHGSATLSGELVHALVNAAGHRMRVQVAADVKSATAEVVRFDDPEHPVRVVFTLAEAEKAGLVKQNPNWVKYPADMLIARVSTRAARRACPEVLYGITATVDVLDERDAAAQRRDDARTFPPGQRPERELVIDADEVTDADDEPVDAASFDPPMVVAASRDWVGEAEQLAAHYGHVPLTALEALRKLLREARAAGEGDALVGEGETVTLALSGIAKRFQQRETLPAEPAPEPRTPDGEYAAAASSQDGASGDPA